MNLKRQLLLVSLMTLMLPWAGCEFIRQTESALRQVQEDMLAGTARALATSLAQYPEEFPPADIRGTSDDRVFLHQLTKRPEIDGYFDDWPLGSESLRSLRGPDGPVRFAFGEYGTDVYVYVEVTDRDVVYATAQTLSVDDGPTYADRVSVISSSPPMSQETFVFATEAPGQTVAYLRDRFGFGPERGITAYWQEFADGYRVEARIPVSLLGSNLGLVVRNTPDAGDDGTRVQSFTGSTPGSTARLLSGIHDIATPLVPDGTRVLITDAEGWRIATAGALEQSVGTDASAWSRRVYEMLVEGGKAASFAEPDPRGRETQAYVNIALDGTEQTAWFRAEDSGQAVIAAATPIVNNGDIVGALILQQGTDAILSLANSGLARLINITIVTTLVVAAVLLGYATWLSRRIRHLSKAAERALEKEQLQSALPGARAGDEVGDLSRSFSYVLRQLDDYNAYLRSLASKLSHELRTPLAIVTSSLDNLEHEQLNEASTGYVGRASEGANRLRKILNAMSEANRVEELMESADPEVFDLHKVLNSTVTAYSDAYPDRRFAFDSNASEARVNGSPELLIQMLDKLVDNAVSFSGDGDTVEIGLNCSGEAVVMSVTNPGPPLPERMRAQLFDSMVSVRDGENTRHLGLGLFVARLIAEGHSGRIEAENVEAGVRFSVVLPNL